VNLYFNSFISSWYGALASTGTILHGIMEEKNQVHGEILISPATDLYQTQFAVHRAGVYADTEKKRL
jgi:hypothetical protein